MRQIYKISIILCLFLFTFIGVAKASIFSPLFGGGSGTITQLDQWVSTTSPTSAITQNVFGKTIKLTGLNGCIQANSSGILSSTGSVCGVGSSNWSTTSTDYWKGVNNFFSTTSTDYWFTTQPVSPSFSTTSADYWKGVNNFFSTTSSNYWYTLQDHFSTTSADYWGLTKGYVTFDYLFPNNSTTTPITFLGSTTLQNFTFVNATGTSATTTNLYSTNLNLGNALSISNGGTGQTTANAGFNALSPMTSQGDMIYFNGGIATRLPIGITNTVLHGGTSPSYSQVVEDDILLSNNSTNNATTLRHGFLPILSNVATQFLNGQGNYATPSGTANSYLSTTFTGQTSVNVIHNFGAYPVVTVMDNNSYTFIPLNIVNNTLNDFTVTFAEVTTGTIIASVGSPQPQNLLVTASNYTVLITDRIVEQTSMNKTLTLPTAVGNAGREFILINASTGNMTVNTTSSQTINGSLTQMVSSGNTMQVVSDGTNYKII